MIRTVDISEVIRKHKGHWFDRSALRFFNSHFSKAAEELNGTYYFISSERHGRDERRFTIRSQTDGHITTIGEFQAYSSASVARSSLKSILAEKQL